MSAVLQEKQHCLIWLGQCPPDIRLVLAAEGWNLRQHPLEEMPAIGLRSQDQVAVMIDLTDCSPSQLPELTRIAQSCSHLECLCLLPDTASRHLWAAVIRHCRQTLDTPLQGQELITCLQTLGQPETDTEPCALDNLIGESPAMLAVRSTVRKFAPVDLPVLITGQTGTGKEVVARALHALSSRAQRPLVTTNCGAIPETLIQAELFGHERGAFTGAGQRRQGLFEHADGGTVFLDEVGDLPADAQTALLRVLQEGTLERIGSHEPVKVDVRVIAATHVDLERAVAEGRFRCDLYYRLNVLRLAMPPLNQRQADIAVLADRALARFRKEHTFRARGFSPAALAALSAHDWPGNVRELINRVQRAAILCERELIEPADLELRCPQVTPRGNGPLDDARRLAEREALLQCLRSNDFNVSATARQMQLSRVTIYRLCRRIGLDPATMR